MIAANDGVLLRNHIPRILRKHFRGKPYYVDLLDLFNEVVQMPKFKLCGFHVVNMLKIDCVPFLLG